MSNKFGFQLTIIVPVYNEEKTIKEILSDLRILEEYCKLEIIVVNDCSKDDSLKIINENKNLFNVLINLDKNKGKGKAVIEGLKKSNGQYILIQDADLEYEPKDIISFLEKIKHQNADLVMGSRFIGINRSVLNFWHMIGNKMITFLFNLLNNTTFSDIYCCYCLFERKNLQVEKLKSNGWGQQAEILTYLVKNSSKIYEVAVNYNGRTYTEGKKIRYIHAIDVIYWILITKLKVLFSNS